MKFLLEDNELSNEFDSAGNQLTKAQAEFFKHSKVRDSRGRLLVCHHGTDSNFDTFKKDYIGNNTHNLGWYGVGYYFFDNIHAAKDFSSIGNVKSCYLNLKNPFIWQYYKTADEIKKLSNESGVKLVPVHYVNDSKGFEIKQLENPEDEIKFTNYLRSKGYDGVINNITYDHEYVAFEPNQIKALTNLNPTNSNNINEELLIDFDYDCRGWVLQNGEIISTNNGPHFEKEHKVNDQDTAIRYNFGYERYIGLPKERLTSLQYETLQSLLDLYFVGRDGVGELSSKIEINCDMDNKGDFISERYSPFEYTTDDIIKLIKRYYTTGKLVENKKPVKR